jgi:hypothetical protein
VFVRVCGAAVQEFDLASKPGLDVSPRLAGVEMGFERGGLAAGFAVSGRERATEGALPLGG